MIEIKVPILFGACPISARCVQIRWRLSSEVEASIDGRLIHDHQV